MEGQKCAGQLAFLLKQKKTKGGSGQVTGRPMASSRGFSQCPSLSSASGEHSLQGALQNAVLSTGGSFSSSFSRFLGLSCGSGTSLPPWLAVLAPLWHHPHAVHRVVLVGRQGSRHAVRIQEFRRLEAAGRGLDARLRSTLPHDGLVRALVLEHAVGVGDLGRRVVGHAAQAGHERPRGEVGREMLVG